MLPKYISIFLCAFIAGVGLGSIFAVPLHMLVTVCIVGMFLTAVLLLLDKFFGIAMFCAVLGLLFGYWYVDKSFLQNQYIGLIGQSVNTEAVVVQDPVTSGKNQQLTLQLQGFTQYVRTSLYTPIPDVAKGSQVWVRGQVELPENFSDFDYIGYLQRYEVYAILKKPRVIVLQRPGPNWRTPLLAVRKWVSNRLNVFPEAEGSLILGMLIGQRQNIPENVVNAFKTTGLTHIVAVSGFNMTVIATACSALVWYLGRRATNILTIAIVFAFVVVTGATAAVVRAAIMAVLMVTAQLLGRQYASLYALLLVAAIMVFLNPRIVIWDIGFQLSVAATFGVLMAFQTKAPDAPESFLADTLRPTLGAIAVTAPIIAIHFQTFSVIAPIANLLVLPFVSWIMLFGALSLLPVVGGAFVYLAQALTSIIIFIATKLASVPHASIDVHLPMWVWAVYYAGLFLYIYFAGSKQLPKREKDVKLRKIIV